MCTIDTDRIYLTWRKDIDKRRHVIGVLERNGDAYTFEYIKENVEIAKKEDNFLYYEPFNNIEHKYSDNVLEFFKRRLLNPQRRDYEDFLNYWGAISYKNDTFSLLGLTGAKLLTDKFEFIAPHNELPAKFNTDISWLNTKSVGLVNQIKTLTFQEIEENISLVQEPDNSYDPKAVKVLFKGESLGYIKSIHCENIFDALNNNRKIKINIANIIKNGTIKEILLRVNID